MFVRAFRVRGPGFHWTHDLVIGFDEENADRATGVVASHAETFVNRVPSLAAMKYDDEYERVNGQWLFARRSIRFLYYVPAEKYLQALESKRRLCFEGAWSEADYPEALPVLAGVRAQVHGGNKCTLTLYFFIFSLNAL